MVTIGAVYWAKVKVSMIFLFYLFSECRLYQSSDCRSFRKIRASWISSKKLNQSESLYFVLDCKLHPQLICQAVTVSVGHKDD